MRNRVGPYFAVLQLFFTLTWTVYVIFLPRLAAQVGIPKQWVVWILLADQVVFLLADWATGIYADRAARVVGKLGPQLALVTLLSALAFVLLPFVAPLASPILFLALTFVWTATSSALRAPPLVLLGKYASVGDRRWVSSLWLFGMGAAGAVAPYLTASLRDADPRLPFVLSSIAVAAAAWALGWAERALVLTGQESSPPEVRPEVKISIPAFLLVAALAGLAFQVHFSLNAAPQYLRFAKPADLEYLMPVFWIGFNLFVLPLTLAIHRYGEFRVLAAGAAAGAAAAVFATLSGSLGALVAAQLAAGAAWSAVMFGAFGAALALGHTGREGYASGGMFSMFALAAALRIAVVALALDAGFRAALAYAPAAMWAAAAAVLAALLVARRRA